jgi:hypothetical protein
MKSRHFGICLLMLLLLTSTALFAETPIQQLNAILIQLRDLQEKSQALDDLGGGLPATNELGADEPEQLTQVQQQIAELIKQRDAIAKQLTGRIYRQRSVQVDAAHINDVQESVITLGPAIKEYEQAKIIDKAKFQWHFKKTDKEKVVYDCTLTFTSGELPLIVGENEPLLFTVSGTAQGSVGPNVWAQALVSVNSGKAIYEGQAGDKVCWVGNQKGATKTANQGAYRITPDPLYSGFSISVGMRAIGSPEGASYYYELEPISNLTK